jgi:hypothetical protein
MLIGVAQLRIVVGGKGRRGVDGRAPGSALGARFAGLILGLIVGPLLGLLTGALLGLAHDSAATRTSPADKQCGP